MDVANAVNGKNVLIAPLNWGLGHATRSIPIIRTCIASAHRVVLASDGAAASLLSQYFPDRNVLPLPAYNVHYKHDSFVLNALLQTPKVWKAIRAERKALAALIKAHQIEVVISDSRFGCYAPDCLNICITHQLNLQHSNRFFRHIINFFNARLLSPFDALWIPDEAPGKLSGALSDHPVLSKRSSFIGIQSVLKYEPKAPLYDLMIILSGPEPRRSILQQTLWEAMDSHHGLKVLFVAGSDQVREPEVLHTGVQFKKILVGNELQDAFNASNLIVCRSGYSTMMDLHRLHKKALLIPTKGQSEQEYLAEYHSANPNFRIVKEDELTSVNLKRMVAQFKFD